MKGNIFTKLFKIILITSIGAIIATIFFCSFTIKQYYLNINMNEIQQEMNVIAKELILNDNQFNKAIIDKHLIKSSIIHCYDIEENIVYSNHNINEYSEKDIDKALQPYVDPVLSGNSVKGVTKLYGLKDDIILVGQAIKKDGQILGGIFYIKMAQELTSSLNGFYVVLGVSMILILISIIIPLYIFIKRIIRPLEDMTKATINMSQGDYDIRVARNNNDEVGELISAFNSLAVKLGENEKQAKLLEQTRKDYIANVSHELKTPVASIRAIGELLNDDMLTDKIDKKKYYSMILRESMRLELLIEDMLELSRLQSGNVIVEKSFIKIEDLFSEVIEEFKIRADDLDINFNIPSNIEEMSYVYTNKNRIIQVLVILLDNAFKFTPIEGNVSISITEEEELVKVSVCDTGVGIEKDDIPFVFDRFYKVDKSHSSKGTGIGLSIASEIMRLLGEDICVNSEFGHGSEFIFTIHKKELLQ